MPKTTNTYRKILKMAKDYGIDKNALFLAAAEQYAVQQKVIDMIKAEIETAESMTTEKTYLKGQKNEYAAPLVRELPKHADSATRTLISMVDIIHKLGKKPDEGVQPITLD